MTFNFKDLFSSSKPSSNIGKLVESSLERFLIFVRFVGIGIGSSMGSEFFFGDWSGELWTRFSLLWLGIGSTFVLIAGNGTAGLEKV